MSGLYYIQNTGFCGNCLKWWRTDGHGYTLDLNDAWKVTAEKAAQLCRNRPDQDIPHKAEAIDAIAARHVNVEALRLAGASK
jgi:hypothetical protein